MQTDTIQPEIYFCRKCYKEIHSTNSTCPQCGKKMQTQSQIKSLGMLVIVLGVLISLGCGLGVLAVISVFIFAQLDDKEVVMTLAGFVWTATGLVAGLTAIAGGAWQKKHGRTSRLFVWIFMSLVVVMLIIGSFFSIAKGN